MPEELVPQAALSGVWESRAAALYLVWAALRQEQEAPREGLEV